VPERIPVAPPELTVRGTGLELEQTAARAARAFFADDLDPAGDETSDAIVRESLNFEIPLVSVDQDVLALELFHGPTLAFKDVGARFMARLMMAVAREREKAITVLVATSGDTGSAVAHAFHGLPRTKVVVLFPEGKVSELQRKLFTTLGGNVSAFAVRGTFDDCQRIAKQAFADNELVSRCGLVSANSINIGRLLPQTFYYFHIVTSLSKDDPRPLVICTPSGNFGNLTAGLIAKRMGLPCERFVAATNVNDVVPEYLETGEFRPRPSKKTLSNAMDVGNPSNFARMRWLYEGKTEMRRDMTGSSHSDEDTLAAIRDVYHRTGRLLDPHSAVGYLGAKRGLEIVPGAVAVFLATAHPAKFADTVSGVTGATVALPRALTECAAKSEHTMPIPPELGLVKEYLLDQAQQ
jgi:threonine synthase